MRKLWRKLFPVRIEHRDYFTSHPFVMCQHRDGIVIINRGGTVKHLHWSHTTESLVIETVAHIDPLR